MSKMIELAEEMFARLNQITPAHDKRTLINRPARANWRHGKIGTILRV